MNDIVLYEPNKTKVDANWIIHLPDGRKAVACMCESLQSANEFIRIGKEILHEVFDTHDTIQLNNAIPGGKFQIIVRTRKPILALPMKRPVLDKDGTIEIESLPCPSHDDHSSKPLALQPPQYTSESPPKRSRRYRQVEE